MNTYEVMIGNAKMTTMALNEWSALKSLCIVKEIGKMIDFVRTSEPAERNGAWIYQVVMNGSLTLAYIKRVA